MPSIGLFGFFILFFLKQGLRFGVFPVAMRHSRIFSAQQKFTFKDISMGLFIFTNLYLWVEIDKNLYLNPNSAEYLDSRIFWIQPFLVLNSLLLLFPLFSKSLSIFVFQPYFQSLLSSHQYSYLVDTQHLTTRSHQNILLRLVFFVKHLILAVYLIFVVALFRMIYFLPFDSRYFILTWVFCLPSLFLLLIYYLSSYFSTSFRVGKLWLHSENITGLFFVASYLFFLYIDISWKAHWRTGLGNDRYEFIRDENRKVICPYPSFYFPFLGFISPTFATWIHKKSCTKAAANTANFSQIQNDILTFDPVKCCSQNSLWNASFILCSDFITASHAPHLQRLKQTDENIKRCAPNDLNRRIEYVHPVNISGYGLIRTFCFDQEMVFLRNVKNFEFQSRSLKYLRENDVTFPLPQTSPNFTPPENSNIRLNVLVLIIDGLSRAHSLRNLPATTQFLQSLYRNHPSRENQLAEVFQFFHYNSVAINTEKNMRAMFTGKTDSTFADKKQDYWLVALQNSGYVTSDVNGYCQTTAFYLADENQSISDHEVVHPFCHPDYSDLHFSGNLKGPYSIWPRCIGQKHVHQHMFDYINSMWDNYASVPKAIVATFQEAHEGTGLIVSTMDEDLAMFLQRFHDDGHMSNTVVVLVSDHGLHMGPYFELFPGGILEQKLPMLYVGLPNWISNMNPLIRDSVIENQDVLVTAADIFHSMKFLETLSTSKILPPACGLFCKISPRNCTEASIPPKYCSCISQIYG